MKGKQTKNSIVDIRKILQPAESKVTSPQLSGEHESMRLQPFQGIILHTLREELLDPLTNNYPLALVNIVNKPIVCYQVEYLLRHGIHDIKITVEKKFASKIERYLRNHFKDFNCADKCSKTTIDMVVFLEEEEPVSVLKSMEPLLHGDLVIIDGNTLIDMPLDELLDTHIQCQSFITCLLKEFDMS